MDDILLNSNNKEYLLSIEKWLSSNFEMNDMCGVKFILNIKIQCDHSNWLLFFSQESILRRLFNCSTLAYVLIVTKNEFLKACPMTLKKK